MPERNVNRKLSPPPPVIPGLEPTLLPDPKTTSIAIDTPSLYRSLQGLYAVMADIDDPTGPEAMYGDRFSLYMRSWRNLQNGATVMRNRFSLEPREGSSKTSSSKDTTTIEGSIGGKPFILRHQTEPTSLVLVEDLLIDRGMERDIGHAVDTVTGQERAIRNNFWSMDELEEELHAIHTLASLGYPVPQNATAHQFFLPWLDTITYDWVPGVTLEDAFNDTLQEENRSEALRIANLFGQHLARVWKPLLDGTLPDGSVYPSHDNIIGNFIYTGGSSPEEAFVRIDVGTLHDDVSPIGSNNYLMRINARMAQSSYPSVRGSADAISAAIQDGFTSQEVSQD